MCYVCGVVMLVVLLLVVVFVGVICWGVLLMFDEYCVGVVFVDGGIFMLV